MKAHRMLLNLLLVLAVGVLAAGCSGLGAVPGGKRLTLGYIGWDESVAVSTLTKVLLTEEFDYDVELQRSDVAVVKQVFTGVADGDLDAFQDVWIPNHKDYLREVKNDVEHLDPWFEGKTAQGIAVPYYMNVRTLTELDRAGTDMIIGIEPGSAVHPQIENKVIPGYHLQHMKLVEGSTSAMLSELGKAYRMREPIVFFGWSPHWMNTKYDFRYLKDPKDLEGRFNDPAKISTIVNENLSEDDPVAYEFIRSISLSKGEVNQMEADINEAADPEAGVKAWLKDNRSVVQPWIDAAKKAQGS